MEKLSREHDAIIGGKTYVLSEGEDDILYMGDWCVVYHDQEGDWYFMHNGKTIYFQVEKKFGHKQK